jgi:hypothetical protein
MWQMRTSGTSPIALLAAVVACAFAVATAAATANAAAVETPTETACAAGFELLAISALETEGPYIMPRMVDTGGNQNGYVCGLALPDPVRDVFCRLYGGPSCALQALELPVYQFVDDDNPALQ